MARATAFHPALPCAGRHAERDAMHTHGNAGQGFCSPLSTHKKTGPFGPVFKFSQLNPIPSVQLTLQPLNGFADQLVARRARNAGLQNLFSRRHG
jgi:hypothetical protein